jgi:colanic acid biosynthesis glycosyl transferase WcaI
VKTNPLIIVCDWIPPAYGAVGQYEMPRAREAARLGRPTTLIGLGKDDKDTQEVIGPQTTGGATLTIVRLAARPAPKASLPRRAFWALGTNLRLLGRTLSALKRGDQAELKVTGSPPFLAYLLLTMNALFLRRTLTYRMTDFYPETAIAAGEAQILKPTVPVFHWLRRRATHLEVLSECQERRLVEAGIPKSRISLVRDKSPVDLSAPSPTPHLPYPTDKVILLYSGNLGVAHDVETFAEAYRRHVRFGPDRVRLWLNATGFRVNELAQFCRQHQLPIHMTPPTPLEHLPGVLSSAAVHLVTLGRPFWGYVLPSKIYACMESGKPVLYVGPEESDIHKLLASVPGAASVRNGDVEACLAALNSFSVSGPLQQTDQFEKPLLNAARPQDAQLPSTTAT